MGLVATWLNGIGLDYAVPAFTAAGIVTPAALAELQVAHFEALGVEDADDRRKLFYLVQRIKMAVDQKDETVNEVDAVLAKTMGNKTNLDHKESNTVDPQMSPRKSGSKENEVVNNVKPNDSPTKPPSQPRRVPVPTVELTDDTTADVDVSGDSEWDQGSDGDSADDEASSVPEIPPPEDSNAISRRQSKRLLEKQYKERMNKLRENSQSIELPQRRPAPTRLGSKRGTSASLIRQASESAIMRNNADAGSSASDGSEKRKAPVRRSSGVPLPKGRRTEVIASNQPKSMRTGKQLSTIPSDSIAPMSPLVTVPPSNLVSDEELKPTKVTARKRTSSLDYGSESDSDARSTHSSKSDRSRRRSMADATVEVTQSKANNPSNRLSFDSARPSRHSLGTLQHTSGSRCRSSDGESSSASMKVTIQGQKPDDSFKAQIGRLREDNDADFELFGNLGTEFDDEEMRIRVVVRKRPMSKAEIAAAGDVDVIHPLDYKSYGRVLVYQPKTRVDLTKEIDTLSFAFDNVFDEFSTNIEIYERTVRNLIPTLFDGQWASIFAYGQTGSGKTFTMMGSNLTGINNGTATKEISNLGLYYMAALDVFQAIKMPGYTDFTVSVSLFEIYSGKLFDLLNSRQQIKCLEDSKGKVCFPGLSEHSVSNADQLIDLIEYGAANRSTGTTSRNADSSRSHAVLQLHLLKKNPRGVSREHSRLTFIDLAGSERGADTSSASRATRMEGAEINTSLLALKEVIRALATGDSMTHVPFRGSKLTQVLKESFVGNNCRSVMIACISPNIGNCEQTLNTLRYADRVKERNSETGELSVDTKQPPKRQTIDYGRSLSSVPDSDSFMKQSGHSVSSNMSFDSNTSAMLDDLLSSPADTESPERKRRGVVPMSATARHIAEQLILDHKAAMTTMLDMIKEEMKIVNQADADRDGLDGYIAQLTAIQDAQVTIIAMLREHILKYRISKSGGEIEDSGAVSDGSFEDLRD